MPLVTTEKMFKAAYDGKFAVGAFNVNNMELLQAIVEAAKAENAPLILQISKGARAYADIKYLKAMIDVAVAQSDLPIAVHCDHGDTFELCKECVEDGYTSVMIDGSALPLDENIALAKKVADYAHSKGVVVEAELGKLAGEEEHVKVEDRDAVFTNPDEAKRFVTESGCDSLAVAIGTKHGPNKFSGEAKINFDRLARIQEKIPGFPLVMHGSSSVPQEFVDRCNKYGGKLPDARGVPEDMIHKAATEFGVCKINIDTDLRLVMTAMIREVFATKPAEIDPRKYLGPARSAIIEMVRHKMQVLNVSGKADLIR
ncbi:MAG: class II fructose-1,6-bisphosphate aldolase [Actinobacteria bacterium]|nr:class II fructose-1,6-bisphosphate aldolase [Actinomycetota bacterium]